MAGWDAFSGSDFYQQQSDELESLFGIMADLVRPLLLERRDLRAADLLPQRHDPEGMHALTHLLMGRHDLKLDDLFTCNAEGVRVLHAPVRDGATRELLLDRHELKPVDLAAMHTTLVRSLRNASRSERLHDQAVDLLRTRSDLQPQDLIGMMGQMGRTVRRCSGEAGMGTQACLTLSEMGENAFCLLRLRADVSPDTLAYLLEVVDRAQAMPNERSPLSRLSHGFARALTPLFPGYQAAAGPNATLVAERRDDATLVREPAPCRAPRVFTSVPVPLARGHETQQSAWGQRGAQRTYRTA